MKARNLLIVGVLAYILVKAKDKYNELANNLIVGTPRIKGFSILSDNNIFPVQRFGDFTSAIGQVFQGIKLLDILSLNFPSVSFRFDLELPMTNNNTFTIPNNSYYGTMSIDGNVIGDVSYSPTDIPANSTVALRTNITTNLSSSIGIIKSLYQNPNIIAKGADFNGTLVTVDPVTNTTLNIPYNFNAKFF